MVEVETDREIKQRLEQEALDAVDHAIVALQDLKRFSQSRALAVAIQYAETAQLWVDRSLEPNQGVT